MTPNQSLFSSRMICSVSAATFWTCSSVVAVGHLALDLGQHARHSPVALGVAAELALGADPVESRADRGNGDGYHHEKLFPELEGVF